MEEEKEQLSLPIRVIDKRNQSFYWMDREFLNGYAKLVGWQGQVVYQALCRHEKNGVAFPSLKHMAIELGVSMKSIQRGVKRLEEWNIIAIRKRKSIGGRFCSNEYLLIAKEKWKAKLNQKWSNQKKGSPLAQ